MWGGGAQSVDNGTAAWGQTSDAVTGWGDPDEPGKASGWGTPSPNPIKPGKNSNNVHTTKTLQYQSSVLLMLYQSET